MANVRLTPQKVLKGSITPSYTAIATGNTYQVRNGGYTILHFKKTGAGVATITLTTPRTVGGLAVADQTFTVPATTGDKMAGPFPPSIFNNGNQDVEFTTDEGTGLTCAVIEQR